MKKDYLFFAVSRYTYQNGINVYTLTKMGKEGNLNDYLLILQMKQGNENAFDKFVRKYYAEILLYCRNHCLDQTEA